MNLRDWQLRARALFTPRRVERELDDELAFHIERETQRLISRGMTEVEARAKALARFGPVPLAADECRDARGTAFVDHTVRDILYALRTFKRAPLVAFTIVSTVALGLALVAVAFTMLNALLFRVDQVPDVHEMFAVERPRTSTGERERFTRAQFDALRRETDVFTDAYGIVSDVDSRLDGRRMFGTFVTGNFFQVLRVHAAIGRALTPADDEPAAGQPVMVLSHRGWDRLFARDPAILGRELLVNGITFEIVGVMPEGFRGLAVGAPDDYWAPLSMLGRVRPIHRGPASNEANIGLDIIGRLKPGLSRQTAQAGLAVWAAGQSNRSPIDPSTLREPQGRPEPGRGTTGSGSRAASTIALIPKRGTAEQPREAMLVTAPLFFAFGLILLIACANVANLLLARAVARQREIGIRLSLGATRRRIVRQLLTESLLLALVAAAAAFAISRVALEAIIKAVATSWPPEIGDFRSFVPDADWRVALFLIVGAGVSTMFFGLVPALQATRIEPIRTIRGEVVRDARPGRARSFLIGLQVSASALLLISSAVFLRSAFAAATFDPGLRVSDIVIVQIANEPTRHAIVQAVTAEPSVAAVAASWPAVVASPRGAFAEAARRKGSGRIPVRLCRILQRARYRGRAGAGIHAGRAFVHSLRGHRFRSDRARVVAACRCARPGRAPRPGYHVRNADVSMQPPLESRTFTVVGVVRNVAGFRIAPFKQAVVYVPTNATMPMTSLVARVHGDPELARQTLLTRFASIDPTIIMEQVATMQWVTRMETYLLEVGFWLTVVLGGLALALTLSGLFSVLSYLVEQRTQEIGVRMALGATTRHITRLVLSQSIRPVGVGLFIGGGSTAGLAALLLASPAAGSIGQIVHVLDPVAYAVSLLIIIAACLMAASIPATRAARLDPTRTLRQE